MQVKYHGRVSSSMKQEIMELVKIECDWNNYLPEGEERCDRPIHCNIAGQQSRHLCKYHAEQLMAFNPEGIRYYQKG